MNSCIHVFMQAGQHWGMLLMRKWMVCWGISSSGPGHHWAPEECEVREGFNKFSQVSYWICCAIQVRWAWGAINGINFFILHELPVYSCHMRPGIVVYLRSPGTTPPSWGLTTSPRIASQYLMAVRVLLPGFHRSMPLYYWPTTKPVMVANKMDKLTVIAWSQREPQVLNLIESWMHQDIPDENTSVEGFHTVQAVRQR